MTSSSTSDPTKVRDINLLAVVDVLRVEGASTRAGIARRTGLSAPTVGEVVSDLVAAEVVRIGGQGPATGGRRGGLVELIPDSYVVAALDLSARQPMIGRVDLCGDLIDGSTSHVPEQALQTPAALVEWLTHVVSEDRVLGLGISVPGVTDPVAGRAEWVPRLGWRDVELRTMLHEAGVNGTVLVDNDLNLAAVGEHASFDKAISSMAMIGLRGGIGAGLIVGNVLLRGSHNAAGEVGYLAARAHPVDGSPEFGSLERAVFEELRMAGVADPHLPHLVDLAGAHAGLSDQAVGRLEDLVLQVVLAVATVLDPESIVLGQELTALLPDLPVTLHDRLVELLPHAPAILPSRLGELASLRGAGIATLSEVAPSLRRLLS